MNVLDLMRQRDEMGWGVVGTQHEIKTGLSKSIYASHTLWVTDEISKRPWELINLPDFAENNILHLKSITVLLIKVL